MLYTLTGTIQEKGDDFVVIDVGNIGFKVLTHRRALRSLPKSGNEVTLCVSLRVHDERLELYGFLDGRERILFEMLNAVAGVGPKTALGILGVDTVDRITAAIIERQADLLTRASGIGKKTAERIILELHNRLSIPKAGTIVKKMDVDMDIEETLVKLGYPRRAVKDAVNELGHEPEKLEERLKAALKKLS